jgi:hypothetical protein
MNARQFVNCFETSVQHQIARNEGKKLFRRPFEPSALEWRLFWVDVFKELCEPLYRVVSLPNPDFSPYYQQHQLISEEDRTITVKSFEEFCSKTEMNHILDSDVATFAIADCIVALAGLVRMIVGLPKAHASFQYQRITHDWQLQVHILVRAGYWRGAEKNAILGAIRQVQFPIERYFCRSAWTRGVT